MLKILVKYNFFELSFSTKKIITIKRRCWTLKFTSGVHFSTFFNVTHFFCSRRRKRHERTVRMAARDSLSTI